MANEFVARNGVIAQNNSVVSGSLVVTNGITGSLFGTSSQALTASYILGGVSGLVFPYSGSAQITGSLGVTGSLVVTGSLTVNGDATVNGTLGASGLQYVRQYNTQTNFLGGTLSVGKQSAATTGYTLDVSGSTRITNDLTVSGSTQITGSLGVTGSLNVTLGITASLFGTASQAVSASYAFTASSASTAFSASFAQTSSFANNFTVANTLTAQTLVVSTVSSSVVYSSGSNIFGNSTANTQTMTGSLNVSGSATIIGRVTATNLTGSLFGTASQAVSSSYALTASYVNPLNQNVLLTGSLSINLPNGPNASIINTNTALILQGAAGGAQTSKAELRITANADMWTDNITASYFQIRTTGSVTNNNVVFTGGTYGADSAFDRLQFNSNYTQISNVANPSDTIAPTASFEVLNQTSGSVPLLQLKTTIGQTSNYVNITSGSNSTPGNVLNITKDGVVAIGTTVTSNESNLFLGGLNANEGGQLTLQPGLSYTSGAMFDNYQDRLRILKGTSTSSDSEVASFNLSTKQFSLPAYNNSSAFPGTAVANLSVDSNGNVITVATGTVISASYAFTASSAISSSYAFTASSAISSSFAVNYLGSGSISTRLTNLETASANLTTASGSFSTRVTQIERTYATTGSNIYTGSQNILGAITASAALINGTITAQTLVVTTVSSSVVFSSGSNIFGNSTANTQTMTGSLNVSGSATIVGRVTTTDLTGSLFGTASQALTASYVLASGVVGLNLSLISTGSVSASVGQSTSSFQVTSGSTTLLYVSNSGNIGIGLTNPSALLHISGSGSGSLIQISSHVSSSIMFVSGSGNVGFGLTQPRGRVHATGSGTGIIGDASDNFFGDYSTGDYIDIGHLGAVGSVFLDTRGTSTNVNLGYRTKGTGNHIWTYGGGVSEAMRINGVGSVGIGTTSLTGMSLRVSKNITGATTGYGVHQDGVVQSDVTAIAHGFTNRLQTQATAFTLPQYNHFYAVQVALGAGSVVTTQAGFFADSSLTSATNNYGFYGNIPSGSNRYNLYMGGTAINYLANGIGIGIAPNYFFDVSTTNNAGIKDIASFAVTGNGATGRGVGIILAAGGSANSVQVSKLVGLQETTSATANNAGFAIQVANSSGVLTEYVRINNSGNLGINTTTPSASLDVSGSVRYTNGLSGTGSVNISGSTLITGSLSVTSGITGSLFGTSSQAVSSSYALTASFALNAGGGGFPYSGSAQITGSLGVTGSFSVSANQGSSVFSSNADTLLITGSLIITGSGAAITGSLNVSNGITGSLFGTSSQAVTASYALTASYVASIAGLSTSQIATGSVTASVGQSSASFQLVSGSTNFLYVSNSGNVGINNAAPSLLSGGNGLSVSGSSYTQLQLKGAAAGGIEFVPSTGDTWEIQAANATVTPNSFIIYNRSDNAYRFLIDGNGNVAIGGSTRPSASLDVSGSVRYTNGLSGTGSVNISGSLTVTGSITTNGTITAQTLVVQTVTSSITYSSGSNIFGNALTNTQTMTGSVNITGSLNTSGSVSTNAGFYVSNTSMNFGPNGANSLSLGNSAGVLSLSSTILSLGSGTTTQTNLFGAINVASSLNVTGSLNLSGSLTGSNARFSGVVTIQSASFDYGQNLSVATGSYQVIASEATSSFRCAFFDYVMFSGSIVRAGTVTSTWSGSATEYYENYTADLGGSTSGVQLQTAISAGNIQLQATASSQAWTIRSLIRLL